jgi:3-hydroxybutyryl-CoA dehydratase
MNAYLWTDLRLGLNANFSATITREKLNYFLEISGDNNPLHTDEIFAKNSGFDSRVVYGLLTASFYSTLVGVYLPGRFALLQSTDIKYLSPVYIDDHLSIEGQITFLNEAYRQIWIDASITNQKQIIVSKAKIKAGLLNES